MCKLMVIINKNPDNKKIIDQFIDANYYSFFSERSGYSIFRNKKAFFYCGDRAYKNFEKNISYKKEELYILHTRTRTSGEEGIDGLHLQTIGKHLFAHNGIVSDFSTVREKSDSYYFFKHYLKRYPIPTPESFEQFAKKKNFSGRAILYNPNNKKLYWLCDQKSNIYIIKDCLIITSFEADTEIKTYDKKSVLGWIWYENVEKKEIEGIIRKEDFDDRFIEFTDGILSREEKIDLTGYQYDEQSEEEYRTNLKKYGMNDAEIDKYYKDQEEFYADQKKEEEGKKNNQLYAL